MMTSQEIRDTFLSFFKEKGHEIVPSAPMVIKNDPTLMFTNAGMNQFKDLFLGNSEIRFPKVTDTQKCLRVSGKHNDLEEVGVDTYHHTLFEMLGNWSFGDYFKKEAIAWAWELLIDRYKLNKDDIYITVFEGDDKDGTVKDQEAYDIWKNVLDKSGLGEERIIWASKKDNFWEMGETGPCGPCSEIHIDLRDSSEKKAVSGRSLVNEDHPLVVEIWNLVFMEYNRMANSNLVPLAKKHVDTGMGFERLTMAIQNKKSNYDTDIFIPIIHQIEIVSGKKYQSDSSKEAVAFRVIADHVRAVAFSIADGQLPSNNGAGYVIRRILRRAIRYGYSFLDVQESFIYSLVGTLCDQMGEVFPELSAQQELIEKVIKEEEESFMRTLSKGLARFRAYSPKSKNTIDGEFAFELYDTFGFPIDLTQLLATEKGMVVDMKGFTKSLTQQKERSRAAGKMETADWVIIKEDEKEEFIGFDYQKATVHITKYRKVLIKKKSWFQLVFSITPFYPEGGGQIGDTGKLVHIDSGEEVNILDTKKENNVILHFVESLPNNIGDAFKAEVDTQSRSKAAANHSATHLLHHVLREVLGEHVSQKGSLVSPEHMRFDFSHFQKVDAESIVVIENKVNAFIRQNVSLNEYREIPIDEAKEKGAMMLFGEKYGDIVRMIEFGDSKELCGGIHVGATGEIGWFKIVSESAVAAGIRRIEAYTGNKAEEYIKGQLEQLEAIKGFLKNPKDIKKSVHELLLENASQRKELEKLQKEGLVNISTELQKKIAVKAGINVIAEQVVLSDSGHLKDLAFQLKSKVDDLFLVLGTVVNDKPMLAVAVSDNLVKEKSLHAGNIVREAAKLIQGGGGGQPSFATAGGKNPAGIKEAISSALNFLS